jgi:hypothetical protein
MLRLSGDERAAVAEVVSRCANQFADRGPLADLTMSEELFETASRFGALACLAAVGETGSGTLSDALAMLLRDAETYYAECVEDDRRALENAIAATDPERWCWEGQTLEDLRVETASVLARSEAGLAAVRALLGRRLLSSISDTGGD